ncbi:MAG: hypothetical protein LBL86_07190 [Coriobacteriales bacterium]|jgi:hypothetical protein|nr:hypothetical protein [Coriobacteriales bacterium]
MQLSYKRPICNRTVKKHRWSEAEETYVRKHARDGARALAARLGVSVGAVKAFASRRAISLSTRPPAAPGLCVECGNAPVHTASREAAARELCEACHLRRRIAQAEEALLVAGLRRRERSLSAQASAARRGPDLR